VNGKKGKCEEEDAHQNSKDDDSFFAVKEKNVGLYASSVLGRCHIWLFPFAAFGKNDKAFGS
jgi:hypothetical protein